MTTGAWMMLAITWSVIITFTATFFWMVYRTPIRPEREQQMRDGVLEKDA